MLAAASACREHRTRPPAIIIAIGRASTQATGTLPVVVLGIDDANLKSLATSHWSNEQWRALLRVTVAGGDSVPIEGRYYVTDSSAEFSPTFPFDAGRLYAARLDPSKLPTPSSDSTVSALVDIKRPSGVTATLVARVVPTSDVVPENVLRMYVEFSAPMSRQPGTTFVHLIDDNGREVKNAFLPLDADFWNPAHTRYTVFFDPGRVKRGILPNEQMGRALRSGRAYAIVVDTAWHDALGNALGASYRREFRAGPAITTPISLDAWGIVPPAAGGRNPLVVRFARALDNGLLRRALGVATKSGAAIPGDVSIEDHEMEWHFTPRTPWAAGDYNLVVLSILEDVAGNRIGRAFEADMFDRVDSTAAPERYTKAFTVK